MAHRVEIESTIPDTRADVRLRRLEGLGFSSIETIDVVDVYTIDALLEASELESIAKALTNPVTQQSRVAQATSLSFDWAVEIGYMPGVTDNVGTTARESIEDLLGQLQPGDGVYSSQITFLSGDLSREDVENIAQSLANPLIQRIHIKAYDEFKINHGMDVVFPHVKLAAQPMVDLVDILTASDDELTVIGKQGIENPDGTRRGPLALDPTYMKAIQSYFGELGRAPTDIELESIAQTWSEHCKHTIFADPMDDINDGLYKRYIKGATERIRKEKGLQDFCVSVFTDNSGAIVFDDNYLVTDKAETHNSPSALDPFGGSITGIVGVNRDTIGFGLAAKPIINRYGFCFADPDDEKPL